MGCEIVGLFLFINSTFSTVGIALYIHIHTYIYIVKHKRFWGQDLRTYVVWEVGVVSQA